MCNERQSLVDRIVRGCGSVVARSTALKFALARVLRWDSADDRAAEGKGRIGMRSAFGFTPEVKRVSVVYEGI